MVLAVILIQSFSFKSVVILLLKLSAIVENYTNIVRKENNKKNLIKENKTKVSERKERKVKKERRIEK